MPIITSRDHCILKAPTAINVQTAMLNPNISGNRSITSKRFDHRGRKNSINKKPGIKNIDIIPGSCCIKGEIKSGLTHIVNANIMGKDVAAKHHLLGRRDIIAIVPSIVTPMQSKLRKMLFIN